MLGDDNDSDKYVGFCEDLADAIFDELKRERKSNHLQI